MLKRFSQFVRILSEIFGRTPTTTPRSSEDVVQRLPGEPHDILREDPDYWPDFQPPVDVENPPA